MPDFFREALESCGLMDAYQQNDFIGWIKRAKRVETQEKRLNQMLEELEKGDVYMNMASRTQQNQ